MAHRGQRDAKSNRITDPRDELQWIDRDWERGITCAQ
jgi:hypothetical protein